MDILIKNGYVVDPSAGIEGEKDILVSKGMVARIEKNIKKTVAGKTVDASGKLVIPGMVDLHCHLREPGREDEETVSSGSRAAAAGGFTTICCMANTEPPLDSRVSVSFIKSRAAGAYCEVLPLGTVSAGRQGKELAPYGEMSTEGACAFSDDGDYITDSLVMRRALEYTKLYGKRVVSHSEDKCLSRDGVMHEGALSARMGLRGIPRQAEEISVCRDIALAELTGGLLHIAHLSTKEAVEAVRRAKKRMANITCEVTLHHLILTQDEVAGYNTNAKVSPPLREKEDMKALQRALRDGTIDCIVTDHAPHSEEEKESGFETAPFGMIGFETAVPVFLSLVKGGMDLKTVISKLTSEPARVFGLAGRGTIDVGSRADIAIIDPEKEWVLSKENIQSMSNNTPLLGRKLKGKTVMTLLAGRVVFE